MFTILSALPAATCHAHHLSEVKQHLLSVYLPRAGSSMIRSVGSDVRPPYILAAQSSHRSNSAELTHPALLIGQRHLPHWLPAREYARWQVLKHTPLLDLLTKYCLGISTLVPSWDQEHLRRLRSKLCWCPAMTFMQRLAGAKGRRSHTRRELSCQGPPGSACTACAPLRTVCCLQRCKSAAWGVAEDMWHDRRQGSKLLWLCGTCLTRVFLEAWCTATDPGKTADIWAVHDHGEHRTQAQHIHVYR